MNRYLVFVGDHYYPNGGWNDFEGSYETYREAEDVMNKAVKQLNQGWGHIADLHLEEVVKNYDWRE